MATPESRRRYRTALRTRLGLVSIALDVPIAAVPTLRAVAAQLLTEAEQQSTDEDRAAWARFRELTEDTE